MVDVPEAEVVPAEQLHLQRGPREREELVAHHRDGTLARPHWGRGKKKFATKSPE